MTKSSRAAIAALSIATMLTIDVAWAQQNTNRDQENQALSPAQLKKIEQNRTKRLEREFMAQLESGSPSAIELAEMLKLDAGRIAATTDHPSALGMAIIRRLKTMSPEQLTNEVLPALEKALMTSLNESLTAEETFQSGRLLNLISALAAIGKEANPVLQEAFGYDQTIDMFLTRKLGPDAGSRIEDLLQNPRDDEYWQPYYLAALTDPGEDTIPVLLENMKRDEKTSGKFIRMVFDRMGPDCVPRVAATLNDPDWFTRWSAAKTFEMMGPQAQAALPALEKHFASTTEDVDVRIAAARAMARIQGLDAANLYQQIPDLESQLLKATHDKSLARRRAYLMREGSQGKPEGNHWPISAWLVAAMTTGQDLELANAEIWELLEKGDLGSADANMVRIFVTCHSQAAQYPGRLEPATEEALKEFYFRHLNRKARRNIDPDAKFFRHSIATSGLMEFNDDLPLDDYIRDYLALSVLRDDPDYRDRKLDAGDTPSERYDALNELFQVAPKRWALHGLQYQIGSSAYIYKTYPHYFNLIDLAPDPVVRKRAEMLTDIIMVESAQMSISGLRGGSKGRAKRGGLGGRWDPYQALLYGEKGSTLFLTMPAASNYQVPKPALLLRKLGKTTKTYEIINDRPTGPEIGAERGFAKDCNAINYAWCTPGYVTGCGMYDPNALRNAGAMGRWSGVIFRNLAAISLDAYTGEKWNVQHKDVRVAQLCSDGPYVPGDTRVAFEALLGKVSEKEGWVFIDNEDAYAAVQVVSGGYFWTDSIKRLLYANDIYSPIIIQTGRAAEYGSFARFQEAILDAPLTYADHKLEYQGPNSAKIEFFSMTPQMLKAGAAYTLPKIDGKTIDLNPEYAYSSPYLQNKAGSSIVTLAYGNRKWEYDFDKNTVTEIQQ